MVSPSDDLLCQSRDRHRIIECRIDFSLIFMSLLSLLIVENLRDFLSAEKVTSITQTVGDKATEPAEVNIRTQWGRQRVPNLSVSYFR